jgi:hypothetical protein
MGEIEWRTQHKVCQDIRQYLTNPSASTPNPLSGKDMGNSTRHDSRFTKVASPRRLASTRFLGHIQPFLGKMEEDINARSSYSEPANTIVRQQ